MIMLNHLSQYQVDYITESNRVLVKAKPLAALPVLVEEQLATIKVSCGDDHVEQLGQVYIIIHVV